MKRKVYLPSDLFPVTGRKGKRARIHENQAITDANAVNSLLLRLPTEIRQIILRMVVGDKLIHLVKVYYDSDPLDSDEEGLLGRSLCVAEVAQPCSPAPNHVITPRPSSPKDAESHSKDIHEGCFDFDRQRALEYKTFSSVFRTSRHISQEALRIFWHTNQFCFETAGGLKHFLSSLQRVNPKNTLKHLVINYSLGNSKRRKWEQNRAPSILSALRGLATLELHMVVYGGARAGSSLDDHSNDIYQGLETFDNLRLLNLEKVTVTISYMQKSPSKRRLRRGELEAIAETFRQRLRDPIIYPPEYLADSILKLRKSLRRTESRVRGDTNQIQVLQQKVDAGRLKADRTKVEINELQAMLQRNDTAEINGVLQTDHEGISSEEE